MSCGVSQVKFQFRRDVAASWSYYNPLLQAGEPGFESDTNQLKIGDGIHRWNDLPYITGGGAGSTGPTGPTGE